MGGTRYKLAKRGVGWVGTLSSVTPFIYEKADMSYSPHALSDSIPSKQIFGCTAEMPVGSKSCPDGTQHSERHQSG